MRWLLTAILLAQGLPTVPTWVAPEARRAQLSRSVVQVEVTMPRQPHVTTFGDDGPRGAAVYVIGPKPESGPILLTAEFLVRGAESVRLNTPSGTYPTRVVRSDARVGFAQLEVPKALEGKLKPAPLTASDLVPHRGFSVADRHLVEVSVVGRGEDQLAFYWAATPSLPGGHAVFDARGDVVGLYAVQALEHPGKGFAIFGAALAGFVTPEEEAPAVVVEPIELRGVGGRVMEQ